MLKYKLLVAIVIALTQTACPIVYDPNNDISDDDIRPDIVDNTVGGSNSSGSSSSTGASNTSTGTGSTSSTGSGNSTDSNLNRTIYVVANSSGKINRFALYQNYVYWTDATGSVNRATKDGTDSIVIASNQNSPHDIDVDDTAVFWATASNITKSDYLGNEPIVIADWIQTKSMTVSNGTVSK